jgi:PhzF family phenazine biosynthesis protein
MSDNTPTVAMVNVFCHDGAGGNPTGLVLDADAMSADAMRRVAEACGHESGFVLPAPDADSDFRFRYFVPRHEMEMCGHATVGALWLLRRDGRIGDGRFRVSTLSGPVEGFVGETVEITQPLGTASPVNADDRAAVLAVLGIDGSALADRPVENACTSRVKTLVPMRSADALNALTPDFARMEALCDRLGSTGLYPYSVIDAEAGTVEARQFPRASGYPEDAATGIAATALASALLHHGLVRDPDRGLRIFQGRAMGSLSEIRVRFATDPATGSASHCLLSGAVRPADH